MKNNDLKIELSLPFKAEYVSVARLTASGVAARMGFDVQAIEDIKVALAEVCNKLVSSGSSKTDCYSILFKILDKKLEIIIKCEDNALKTIFRKENDELGISIIEALMDSFEMSSDDAYILKMFKELEGSYL